MQSLQQRMWHEEVEESCVQGAAAKRRRVAAEEEEREAMRELDRVQAEGPANHRKRDPIDKVPSLQTQASSLGQGVIVTCATCIPCDMWYAVSPIHAAPCLADPRPHRLCP